MDNLAIQIAQGTSVHDPRPYLLDHHSRPNHVLVLGMRTPQQRRLLFDMIAQDIENGAGLAVIDTTGHFARSALDAVPAHRAHSTYLMRPDDPTWVVGFNPFQGVAPSQRALTSQHIMDLFKDIWSLDYDRTPLLLDLLRSAARLLLDAQDGTLIGMYPLLTNDQYRETLVKQCSDSLTKRFWTEFGEWPKRDRRDRVQPVLTRLRAFLSDPNIRNVLGQVRARLDLPGIVRDRQILIADLDRTKLGPETARLLACLLATRLQIALDARRAGWPFYLYLPDLEQVHVGIGGRLLQGRYTNAGIVAGIGNLDGVGQEHRPNLLAAETLATFRISPDDVRHIAPRFATPQPEVNLPQLSGDRLAVSGYLHELKLNDYELDDWGQRASIEKRSRRALGVPKKPLERKIDGFIKRF